MVLNRKILRWTEYEDEHTNTLSGHRRSSQVAQEGQRMSGTAGGEHDQSSNNGSGAAGARFGEIDEKKRGCGALYRREIMRGIG